jgi:hypothetical protein
MYKKIKTKEIFISMYNKRIINVIKSRIKKIKHNSVACQCMRQKKDLRKVLSLTCNKNFDTYNQKCRMEIIQNVRPKFLYMGPKNKMKQDYIILTCNQKLHTCN